ncbi:MAG: hypothetical protein R3B93_16140 [Bacteroidia bacterium]
MQRRNFIKSMGTMSLAPLALSGIPVNLLANSTLANSFSCDDVADRALVLIQLSGGNDGLNTLIPVDHIRSLQKLPPKRSNQ